MGLLGTTDPVAFKPPAAVLKEGVQCALQKVWVSDLDNLRRLTDSLEDYEIIHRWWGVEVHNQNLRYHKVAKKKGQSDPLSCPQPLICRSVPPKSVSLHHLHAHVSELRTIKRHLEKSLMSDIMAQKFSQLQLPGMRSHVVLACVTALHLILHKGMRPNTPVRSSQMAFVICGTPSVAEMCAAWNMLLKNDENFNLNTLLWDMMDVEEFLQLPAPSMEPTPKYNYDQMAVEAVTWVSANITVTSTASVSTPLAYVNAWIFTVVQLRLVTHEQQMLFHQHASVPDAEFPQENLDVLHSIMKATEGNLEEVRRWRPSTIHSNDFFDQNLNQVDTC